MFVLQVSEGSARRSCDGGAHAARRCEAEACWLQHQACPTHTNTVKPKVPSIHHVHFIVSSSNNLIQKKTKLERSNEVVITLI